MSRSGYHDDHEQWDLIRWRGAVASAIRGKRGQAFLKELLTALDALPRPELISKEFEKDGDVCALGALGKKRGLDMTTVDPEDSEGVASAFGLPHALACEVMYINDEADFSDSDWHRFERVRKWIIANLKTELR